MKDVRPALRALLLSSPPVATLVGNSRVFPAQLPQGERRASVVYSRIAGTFVYQMNGSGGLLQNLVTFESIAPSNDAATELANAVHDILTGHRGEVFYGSDSPQASVVIQGIFQTNDRDLYDAATQLHRVSRDFAVWFVEG